MYMMDSEQLSLTTGNHSVMYIVLLLLLQSGNDRPFKDWVLEKENELRLEVGSENTIELQV